MKTTKDIVSSTKAKSKAKPKPKPQPEVPLSLPRPKTFILFRLLALRRNLGAKKPLSFIRLVKERRFDEICHILEQQPLGSNSSWLNVTKHSRVSKYESLHALCMYRPTVAVVQAVIDTLKATTTVGVDKNNIDVTMVVDAQGRTPLHIAAASNCSVQVIQLLMRDNTAVLTKDHARRYPLHWACAKPGSKKKLVDNMVQVINSLIEEYPISVIAMDHEGNTPMDLATANKADKQILAALRFVAKILPANVSKSPSNSLGTATTYQIPREAYCDEDDDDDLSSVGSQGVSRHAQRYFNGKQRSPNLLFF
jgi:Ankyrin repeats (many copies)